MYINSIKVKNFRLIKDATLNLKVDDKDTNINDDQLSLLIGRNNTGKTSLIVLLERFLGNKNPSFQFDDFSLCLRQQLLSMDKYTNVESLSISLLLDIHYDEKDNLANISDFILDLDDKRRSVKIYFETKILLNPLLKELDKISDRHREFIKKYLYKFLLTKIYALENESDLDTANRVKLEEQIRDWSAVKNLINIQVIHAKRDVASSESSKTKAVLSRLTSDYFNKKNKFSFDDITTINKSMIDMDVSLNKLYENQFEGFLDTAKEFLGLNNLGVISALESEGVVENFSKVIYGEVKEQLPEHLNGLGYMNILYLILQIEIRKLDFEEEPKDINLLVIEEPEAHTHPQMQYVFIDKIKKLISTIPNIQTLITSHSSHIVNRSDFKSIRYFLKSEGLVKVKDFYRDLNEKYSAENGKENKDEKANFKFLQQYLTVHSSELFFSEKIIFIEGTTEKLLLPLFINQLDQENKNTPNYKAISSQNISILEVGANAKAFRHFIDFLQIRTLVITDIDTAIKKPAVTGATYPAAPVKGSTHTSNASIKYYLNAPDISAIKPYSDWMEKLKTNQLNDLDSLINIAYQYEENNYHARSFEDSFIAINLNEINNQKDKLEGLKLKVKLADIAPDFYQLTEDVLGNKSEFASSLLWLALTEDVTWKSPKYLKEGLLWIAK